LLLSSITMVFFFNSQWNSCPLHLHWHLHFFKSKRDFPKRTYKQNGKKGQNNKEKTRIRKKTKKKLQSLAYEQQ
jgi:hypothetical protein